MYHPARSLRALGHDARVFYRYRVGQDPPNWLSARITQGTRSREGRKTNERLWTVIATCELQGRSAFNFILKAVQAYFHNQSAPSLLPGST